MSDLPIMSFHISVGTERATVVNFFYREFTGGVSGLDDTLSQNDRLRRTINHWTSLSSGNRDFVCLGDANLCAIKWNDEDYSLAEQAGMVQRFLLDSSCSQIVQEYTRSEIVRGGTLSRSCIDHVYTNNEEKLTIPEVLAVGDSDHLGVTVTKYTKEHIDRPKTVKKRSYKNFNIESFLNDILLSNINDIITSFEDLEGAADKFEKIFKHI